MPFNRGDIVNRLDSLLKFVDRIWCGPDEGILVCRFCGSGVGSYHHQDHCQLNAIIRDVRQFREKLIRERGFKV